MFSTNDHNPHRYLRIYVTALERKEELETLDGLERLGDRVKAFPSEPLLMKLAKEIVKVHRSSGLPVEAVEIEVFRIEYAKPNLIPKSRSLRKYHYNSDHE